MGSNTHLEGRYTLNKAVSVQGSDKAVYNFNRVEKLHTPLGCNTVKHFIYHFVYFLPIYLHFKTYYKYLALIGIYNCHIYLEQNSASQSKAVSFV